MDIKQLKISLEKLKADTKPRWGRMNSSQMLKHCNRQAKLYCNEYKSNFFVLILAHTIGKLHLLYAYQPKNKKEDAPNKEEVPEFIEKRNQSA